MNMIFIVSPVRREFKLLANEKEETPPSSGIKGNYRAWSSMLKGFPKTTS